MTDTPNDLLTAAEEGDRLGVLRALCDALIVAFSATTSARDLATLSRRIVELDAEIAAIVAAEANGIGEAALLPDEPFDPNDL